MNRNFLFKNQGNVSVSSVALGASLVFTGVLLVNSASNEYRIISMDDQCRTDNMVKVHSDANLSVCSPVFKKSVCCPVLKKHKKMTLGIIFFVAILVIVLVIVLALKNGNPIETSGNKINNKDSATNKTKQKPTSESSFSPKSSSENKISEVVQYSLKPVVTTTGTIAAVYGLNKVMESSDSSKAKLKGKSTPRLANETKLIQGTSEIHKKKEKNEVGPQGISSDQVTTDNTEVVVQETSITPKNNEEDKVELQGANGNQIATGSTEVVVQEASVTTENNEEEKTEPESLVVDSNLKQDNAKKSEDEGNKNREEGRGSK